MSTERCAERQWGVVTFAQARAAGLSPQQVQRRIESGRWRPVRHGVYAIAGAPPSWEQAVMAAVLASGDGTVASHSTGWAVWALPQADRGRLEISTDRPDQRRLRGVVAHRTTTFLADEHTVRAGIPVTSVARTLVDCSGRLTVAELGTATDDALRRGVLSIDELRRCVAGLRPAPGRHPNKIRSVLAKRLPGYDPGESGLQMRFARALVARGCPEPVLEHRVRLGGRRYRIDLAYPDVMLAIEIDGWEWHHTRSAFDADRARANALVAAGWTLLRFTSTTTDADAAARTRATLVRLSSPGDENRTNGVGGGKVA